MTDHNDPLGGRALPFAPNADGDDGLACEADARKKTVLRLASGDCGRHSNRSKVPLKVRGDLVAAGRSGMACGRFLICKRRMIMDTKELTQAIGNRLRAARAAQQLSLSQLSEKTQKMGNMLSKSRISNYEQGIRRMGIEQARILAQALGTVSAVYLLCLEDSEPELSLDEQRLLCNFRAASSTGRLRVLEAADAARED